MYKAHNKQRKCERAAPEISSLKEIFPKIIVNLKRSNCEYYHPGKSADIISNNNILGSFGELHPKLMKKFQIKRQTVLGCLFIDLFLQNYSGKDKLKNLKLSPFLTLKKDFSFILPNEAMVEDLIKAIKMSNNKIGEVLIFDIYKSENKDKGISVGVEVEIMQDDKVLNSKEISEIMNDIILIVKKEVNAELRT